jgi:hypothetical protein
VCNAALSGNLAGLLAVRLDVCIAELKILHFAAAMIWL